MNLAFSFLFSVRVSRFNFQFPTRIAARFSREKNISRGSNELVNSRQTLVNRGNEDKRGEQRRKGRDQPANRFSRSSVTRGRRKSRGVRLRKEKVAPAKRTKHRVFLPVCLLSLAILPSSRRPIIESGREKGRTDASQWKKQKTKREREREPVLRSSWRV